MRIQMPTGTTLYPRLSQAITIANKLLQGEEHFLETVAAIPSFALSENTVTHKAVTGAQVVAAIARDIMPTVTLYKSFFPNSRACGATITGTTIISLNSRKMGRSTEELVGTLIHECVHIADNDPKLSFGHGNNRYTNAKKNTAPYKIQTVAEEIAIRLKAENNPNKTAMTLRSMNLKLRCIKAFSKL